MVKLTDILDRLEMAAEGYRALCKLPDAAEDIKLATRYRIGGMVEVYAMAVTPDITEQCNVWNSTMRSLGIE